MLISPRQHFRKQSDSSSYLILCVHPEGDADFLLFETCIDKIIIYFHVLPYLHLLFCLGFTAIQIRFSCTHWGWKMWPSCAGGIGEDPHFTEQGYAATHELLSDVRGTA